MAVEVRTIRGRGTLCLFLYLFIYLYSHFCSCLFICLFYLSSDMMKLSSHYSKRSNIGWRLRIIRTSERWPWVLYWCNYHKRTMLLLISSLGVALGLYDFSDMSVILALKLLKLISGVKKKKYLSASHGYALSFSP